MQGSGHKRLATLKIVWALEANRATWDMPFSHVWLATRADVLHQKAAATPVAAHMAASENSTYTQLSYDPNARMLPFCKKPRQGYAAFHFHTDPLYINSNPPITTELVFCISQGHINKTCGVPLHHAPGGQMKTAEAPHRPSHTTIALDLPQTTPSVQVPQAHPLLSSQCLEPVKNLKQGVPSSSLAWQTKLPAFNQTHH
jgi:hypothetical protein